MSDEAGKAEHEVHPAREDGEARQADGESLEEKPSAGVVAQEGKELDLATAKVAEPTRAAEPATVEATKLEEPAKAHPAPTGEDDPAAAPLSTHIAIVSPPLLRAIDPKHGPLAGGLEVMLFGEAFAEGCSVSFGGVDAHVTRESEATLRVRTPSLATGGLVAVRVTHPDGSTAELEDVFRYDPAPVLTGFAPPCLSTEGGGVLTILGAEFVQGAVVRVGGELVPSSFANAGRLEVVTQKRDPGEASVSVENPDGQIAQREGAVRFAAPPRIDAVVPASVPVNAGAEVKVAGRGFEDGVAVLLSGARVEGVTRVSDVELRFPAARREPGRVDVTVVNPSGLTATVASALTFVREPPVVESVSPDAGPSAGGTVLVARGRGFDPRVLAFVCGLEAKLVWKSSEEIHVTTPEVARDGIVDVRVVNPDGQFHELVRGFRYHAALRPPKLSAVGSPRGSQLGGLEVALLGEDFAEGCTAKFGGTPAEVRFLTHKEVRAITPARVGFGDVPVELTNPDGQVSVLEGAFAYDPKPAPEITSVTPNFGPTTGGTRFVIEGKNFTRDAAVYIGREHPRDMAVKSATEIVVVAGPRKLAGVVDVEVACPGAPHGVAKNGFRYDATPAPLISGVSPNAGAVAGGTELTVSGKNFTKETVVLVGGKAPAKPPKLIDAATLEIKTPPGDAGKMVDVVVRNPDGKEAVQKRAFLYDPRYR